MSLSVALDYNSYKELQVQNMQTKKAYNVTNEQSILGFVRCVDVHLILIAC